MDSVKKYYIVWEDYNYGHVEEFECTNIGRRDFDKRLNELKQKEQKDDYGTLILLAVIGEVMIEALTGKPIMKE